MTNRRSRSEFSKRTKIQRFDHCGGFCEKCGAKLRPGQFDFDHDLETVEGGGNSFENCRAICKSCHKVKTKTRAPVLAKSRRIEEKHLGLRKPKGQPMAGTKRSGWRRRMDGTIERRE